MAPPIMFFDYGELNDRSLIVSNFHELRIFYYEPPFIGIFATFNILEVDQERGIVRIPYIDALNKLEI